MKVRMDRQVTSWVKEGEAQPYEEAQEEFKDRPAEWNSIVKNAHQFTCPIRSILMIVAKPKYKFSDAQETMTIEERKRKIEGEATIKKAKAPKVIKDEIQEALQLLFVWALHVYNSLTYSTAPIQS